MTLLIPENLDQSNQRKLFALLGVDIVATKLMWIHFPLALGIGIGLSFFLHQSAAVSDHLLTGAIYGVLILVSEFTHGFGHIISGHLVQAPMQRLVVSATVITTQYDEEGERPSRIHVGRSIGGPGLNLIIGIICMIIWKVWIDNPFVLFLGVVNLAFCLFTLSPIPTLDGVVIIRELRNWRT